MVKKIIIPYFHVGLKYTTPFFIGLGIYLAIIGYSIWTAILALVALIILTTNYVTEIDFNKKEYRDFLSFLGFAFDEEKNKFKSVNKIVIVKENHSQMLNSRSRSRQLDWASFTATLILDGNKTLNLITRNNKKELVEGLLDFAKFLNVNIEDQTTGQNYMIGVRKI